MPISGDDCCIHAWRRSRHAHVRMAMLIVALLTCSSMAVDQSLRRQGAAQALLAASERMAGVVTPALHQCMLVYNDHRYEYLVELLRLSIAHVYVGMQVPGNRSGWRCTSLRTTPRL